MKNLILYGLPMSFDIIVGLTLFVGRHGLASRGYDETVVGSIVMFYGIGYVIASLSMSRIIKPALAKQQLLAGLAAIIVICLILANTQQLVLIQALYGLLPLATSLLFNAFQIFMLGISNQDTRPLAETAGHFTFAWSMGFALGPFVSSLLKNVLPWAQIYYLAAALAAVAGIVLYSYRPQRPATIAAQTAETQAANGRSLVQPAWLGLVVGLTVWTAVSVYWPVQAVHLNIPATQRGWVEFAFALTQGFAALLLTYVHRWHYKPGWLLVLGGAGVVALSFFGLTANVALFVVASMLFGTYLGGLFSYMVYHSMVEEEQAVRRVALNETFVGISFLAASPVANALHREGTPFGPSYLILGAILIAGVLAQTFFARTLLRREHP